MTAHESINYRNGMLQISTDTCDRLMRSWILDQIFQIPNTQIQVLNDPNVLRHIYLEVENRYGIDPQAVILNDLQNMFAGEDPAVIEAWLNYIYQLKATQVTDYYPLLLSQNFGYMLDTTKNYTDSLYWREQHLYGSSRLGMHRPDREVAHTDPSYRGLAHSLHTGMRQYELTNHLGNVLSTIKDEKKQIANGAGTLVSYYEPIVWNASDYYPFGMPMPNRQYSLSSGSKYRFGFNGKEMDNEVYGEGNAIDFGARIHDARVGRFLSLDPLSKGYPMLSNYSYSGNNPIYFIEIGGKYFTGHTYLVQNIVTLLNRYSGDTRAQKMLAQIRKIEASEVEVHLFEDKFIAGSREKGGDVIFDSKNNRLRVGIYGQSRRGNFGIKTKTMHELNHVEQFLDSRLVIITKDGEFNGSNNSKQFENECFNAQSQMMYYDPTPNMYDGGNEDHL